MWRAATRMLFVQSVILLYPACRANRRHSSTRRAPMPSPRAFGSTSSKRSLATVGGGPRPADEAALLEGAQDAAQIARVEAEVPAQLGRRRPILMRQLVEHAHFRKREGALEITLVEQADLPGIEPIEPTHGD